MCSFSASKSGCDRRQKAQEKSCFFSFFRCLLLSKKYKYWTSRSVRFRPSPAMREDDAPCVPWSRCGTFVAAHRRWNGKHAHPPRHLPVMHDTPASASRSVSRSRIVNVPVLRGTSTPSCHRNVCPPAPAASAIPSLRAGTRTCSVRNMTRLSRSTSDPRRVAIPKHCSPRKSGRNACCDFVWNDSTRSGRTVAPGPAVQQRKSGRFRLTISTSCRSVSVMVQCHRGTPRSTRARPPGPRKLTRLAENALSSTFSSSSSSDGLSRSIGASVWPSCDSSWPHRAVRFREHSATMTARSSPASPGPGTPAAGRSSTTSTATTWSLPSRPPSAPARSRRARCRYARFRCRKTGCARWGARPGPERQRPARPRGPPGNRGSQVEGRWRRGGRCRATGRPEAEAEAEDPRRGRGRPDRRRGGAGPGPGAEGEGRVPPRTEEGPEGAGAGGAVTLCLRRRSRSL